MLRLDDSYPLRGAQDHWHLNTVLNALARSECPSYTGRIDVVATTTGTPHHVVREIARWYQSLWMVA